MADKESSSVAVNGDDDYGGVAAKLSTMTISSQKISELYPVNTLWEMTLENDEVVTGRIYCTDEFSQSVVIQRSLAHTTLASEVRIVNAASIRTASRQDEPEDESTSTTVPLSKPLPKIHKKTLEERERKALRQAEESFRHINQKATPRGQACFDRLLKACNEVVWKEESILVLHQIRVDPPYTPESCSIVARNQTGKTKALEDSSLERVRKIVESEPTT